MWQKLAWIALAGAIGTLSRYGLSGVAHSLGGAKYPWGTLAVNAVGCFLFGMLAGLAEDRLMISGQTRFILATGFLGAFTTFSTFAFETEALLRDSQWMLAGFNLASQNLLGLVGIFAGFAVGRMF